MVEAPVAELQRWLRPAGAACMPSRRSLSVSSKTLRPCALRSWRLEQWSGRGPDQQAQAAQAPDLRPRRLRVATTPCPTGRL